MPAESQYEQKDDFRNDEGRWHEKRSKIYFVLMLVDDSVQIDFHGSKSNFEV